MLETFIIVIVPSIRLGEAKTSIELMKVSVTVLSFFTPSVFRSVVVVRSIHVEWLMSISDFMSLSEICCLVAVSIVSVVALITPLSSFSFIFSSISLVVLESVSAS